MPFALVFIGLILVVTGAKNTYPDFGTRLKGDFTGPKNFTYWLVALGAVGAVGYAKPLHKFSNVFLALIIVAMMLANGGQNGTGFFQQVSNFLQNGPRSPHAAPAPNVQGSTAPTNQTSSNDSVGDAVKLAATVAPFLL